MRKRLKLLTAIVAITVCFGGCSCSSMASLNFTNAFNGGTGSKNSNPLPGYTETLLYNVEYTDSSEYFTKTTPNGNNAPNVSYSNGKYLSTLTVLPTVPTEITSEFSTDVPLNPDDSVYSLKTEFSIDVSVKQGEKETTRTDSINSVIYFCPFGTSYAPIYSKTVSSYTIIYIGETSEYYVYDSESVIKYNQKSYEITSGVTYHEIAEAPKPITQENISVKSYEYDYTTVVDNAQLLFVLRNMNLTEGSSANLPTVEQSYGEHKVLSVTNESESEKDFNITYNGNPLTEKIKYKKLSYKLNSTTSSGTKQFLSVQKTGSETLPYKALPLTYAKPILTSGNVSAYGTLIFTLTSVTVG